MSTGGWVHWHEGLFLRPQHLQIMDREAMERTWGERRIWRQHHYGLIEVKLVGGALGTFTVQFDSVRAVMPSGLIVDVPGNADLAPRDVRAVFKESTRPLVVRLGVPKWNAHAGNTFDGVTEDAARVRRLYRLATRNARDENTGEDPQDIYMRRVNARLVLPGDDVENLELLELLRLEHSADDDSDQPREDLSYVPPCFCVGGSQSLRNLLRDLAAAVAAGRLEQLNRIAGPGIGWNLGAMDGKRMQQWLRLRTLNRFAATLPSLLGNPMASPLEIYRELRALQGELAALTPDADESRFAALDYSHENLGEVFRDVSNKIRPMLKDFGRGRVKSLRFRREGAFWACEPLDDTDFTLPTDYFLGIQTGTDPATLDRLVLDNDIKLLPGSVVGLGAKPRIPGVKLERDFAPPTELPRPTGRHYFRLLREMSSKLWGMTQKEKAIVIFFREGKEPPIQEMNLCLLLPEAPTRP